MMARIDWRALARDTAARRERQIPVTQEDAADIETVASAAMEAIATILDKPQVTVTRARGGVIVHVTGMSPGTTSHMSKLRAALEQLGYVLAAQAFTPDALTVTGRDPHHTWREASTEGNSDAQ